MNYKETIKELVEEYGKLKDGPIKKEIISELCSISKDDIYTRPINENFTVNGRKICVFTSLNNKSNWPNQNYFKKGGKFDNADYILVLTMGNIYCNTVREVKDDYRRLKKSGKIRTKSYGTQTKENYKYPTSKESAIFDSSGKLKEDYKWLKNDTLKKSCNKNNKGRISFKPSDKYRLKSDS